MFGEWFWKKLSSVLGLLAIAVLFALTVFSANIEIKDLDLWLHLGTGRHILQYLSVPQTDIFSCTISGQSWINHEWLFQTLVYAIYSIAGTEGLINMQVLIVSMTFAFILFLGYNHDRQLGIIFVLFLVLLVYQCRFTIRPDLFSILFLVLYIYILGEHIDKGRSVWSLFLIQVLWTNIHGFFILGPVIVLLGIISEWLKKNVRLPYEWNTTARLTDDEFRRLKNIFVFVFLATFINPYFIRGMWYPFSVLLSLPGESEVFFKYIRELHRPISWTTIFSLRTYPYFKGLIVVSFTSFILNRKKIDLSAILLWGVFLLLALTAVRNIAIFAFIAYFVFLTNFPHISLVAYLPPRLRNSHLPHIFSIVGKTILILWMFQLINHFSTRGYYDFQKYERKSEFRGISQKNFPARAVDFLVENKIYGNFFNDFNSGAYLIGRAAPEIKNFIDGRTEVYGADFFKRYRKVWDDDQDLFEQMVRQYDLTGAFLNFVFGIPPEEIMQKLYRDENWVLVYFDDDAAIYLKDIPQNQKWIKKYRIDLDEWQTPTIDLLRLGTTNVTPDQHIHRAKAFLRLELWDQAFGEGTEALRIAPHYAGPYDILGRVYLKKKDYKKAFEYLRKVKLFNPYNLQNHYRLGVCFYHLGDYEKADNQCQRILSKNPKNPRALYLLSRIYAQQKNYENALKMVDVAFGQDSGLVDDLLEVGDIFFAHGRWQDARDIYELALETEKRIAEIHAKIDLCEVHLKEVNETRGRKTP